MTAAKLKELEAKATEGTLEIAEKYNCVDIRVIEGPYIANFNQSAAINWQRKEANAKLYAYLRNHAKDFIKLIDAAEVMCGQTDGDDLEAEANMLEALAAFKDKS